MSIFFIIVIRCQRWIQYLGFKYTSKYKYQRWIKYLAFKYTSKYNYLGLKCKYEYKYSGLKYKYEYKYLKTAHELYSSTSRSTTSMLDMHFVSQPLQPELSWTSSGLKNIVVSSHILNDRLTAFG